jgi:hypothetical protein
MEGVAAAHPSTGSMWRRHFRPVHRTATRSMAAPVVAYEGGAREARSAPGLLEEMREGQEDH